MAKKKTHTLTIHSKHTYSIADIERRQLPELVCTLVYDYEDEDGQHWFSGALQVKYGSDRHTGDLSLKLKKMLKKKYDIGGRGFKATQKQAIDWADQTIAEFLESGLFSIAVLDASGANEGRKKGPRYEYEPVLQVVKAEVFQV
jgi:hypothetical protein